jgi:mRNA-binding protein PUF3
MRGTRFNDFTRPPGGPSIDEASSQMPSQNNLANNSSWIWRTPGIGSSFGNSDRRGEWIKMNKMYMLTMIRNKGAGPGSDDTLLQAAPTNTYEAKQGSSSLLPGSGEHDSWNTKPSVMGWAGDSTSPGLATVGMSQQDLSRSPVRVRANQKYESPKQKTEIPRSSSPFYPVSMQGGVALDPSIVSSPQTRSLDPSSVSSNFGGALEFQSGNRGRTLEMGQYGNQRFTGASPKCDPVNSRHLSILPNAIENDDPGHLRRGRGLSNSRGIVPAADLLGTSVSSAGRSESLPPQQRANSTPPTYPDQSPPNGTGYPSYTHIPTGTPGAPQAPPTYPQGRYMDLSRETREAEMLAQFKHMSTEDENESYQGRRPLYPSFSHTPPVDSGNANFVSSQPQQFGLQSYQRHIAQGSHGSSPWSTDETLYGPEQYTEQFGSGEAYDEYERLRSYDRNGAMSPGDQNGDHSRRSVGSPYYPAGTPPSGMDIFRSPSRGGSTNRGPQSGQMNLHPERLRQQLLVTQQQQQQQSIPAQMLMRDQLYRQQQHQPQFPASNPYDYTGYSNVRMPMPSFSGSMSPLVPPTHPGARRHEDFGSLRSALLEEFRSNSKSNKRYELKVIFCFPVLSRSSTLTMMN